MLMMMVLHLLINSGKHPLIIRSNRKEFHVPLYVDLANQIIQSKPIEETEQKHHPQIPRWKLPYP